MKYICTLSEVHICTSERARQMSHDPEFSPLMYRNELSSFPIFAIIAILLATFSVFQHLLPTTIDVSAQLQ